MIVLLHRLYIIPNIQAPKQRDCMILRTLRAYMYCTYIVNHAATRIVFISIEEKY